MRRLPDDVKKLKQTLKPHRVRAEAARRAQLGAVLTSPPPVPRGLPKEVATVWRTLAPALVEASRARECDLHAFRAACECAVLRQRALDAAMTSKPAEETERGALKTNAFWSEFSRQDAAYSRWLTALGLVPPKGLAPEPAGSRPVPDPESPWWRLKVMQGHPLNPLGENHPWTRRDPDPKT